MLGWRGWRGKRGVIAEQGRGFLSGPWKCLGTKQQRWWYSIGNVLTATALHTLKWLKRSLCYVSFAPISVTEEIATKALGWSRVVPVSAAFYIRTEPCPGPTSPQKDAFPPAPPAPAGAVTPTLSLCVSACPPVGSPRCQTKNPFLPTVRSSGGGTVDA